MWAAARRNRSGRPTRWADSKLPLLAARLRRSGCDLLFAAMKSRVTTAPMMMKPSSSLAETTSRAVPVRGVMSPKPTFRETLMVK